MAAKIVRVKVFGENEINRVRQLALALGKSEEEIVSMAINNLWGASVSDVRAYLEKIAEGTALFAQPKPTGDNGFDIAEGER